MTLASFHPGPCLQHVIATGDTARLEDLEVDLELAGADPAGRAAGQAFHREQQGMGSILEIPSFAQVERDHISKVSQPGKGKGRVGSH